MRIILTWLMAIALCVPVGSGYYTCTTNCYVDYTGHEQCTST